MIVTYEEVADFFGDPLFTEPRHQLFVRAALDFAKRYCGRPFERGTYTETVSATGGSSVYVAEENITEIHSVFSDSRGEFEPYTEITDLSRVHAEGNRIVFESGYWPVGEKVVRITYTGGYWPWDDPDPTHVPKMPDDLRLALMRMVMTNRMRSEREYYQSESFTGYSYSRGIGSNVSSGHPVNATGFDDMVIEILDQYRRYY